MTLIGVVALTLVSHIFGSPLSYEEKRRTGTQGNVYRMPVNLEVIVAVVILLGGVGILFWSNFELCAFLNNWVPSLSSVYRVLLACR